MSTTTKRLLILGSTGSIGRQTVEVVTHLNALSDRGQSPVRFEIVGLAAGRNHDSLLAQASALDVSDLALVDSLPDAVALARSRGQTLRIGPDSAEQLACEVEADLILGAIVGSAGLGATLAGIERGADIALANKETLVAAGSIVTDACARTGARLLPVDSEHSAIWQCLLGASPHDRPPPCEVDHQVARIILTASGGALRKMTREQTFEATPADALAHPTWSMGAKVTIDSASLTNKALEVIEAHWLFGLDRERIDVLIHPPSIVHSFVEFADGSVLAQLGAPDMRTPIQFALTYPARAQGCSNRIEWSTLRSLEFEEPDLERFPALGLGYRVVEQGGTSGAIFNAANEAAVEAFLAGRIPFGIMGELVAGAMDEIGVSPVRDLTDIARAESEAGSYVRSRLEGTSEPARVAGSVQRD